jgi:hypothetical protein
MHPVSRQGGGASGVGLDASTGRPQLDIQMRWAPVSGCIHVERDSAKLSAAGCSVVLTITDVGQQEPMAWVFVLLALIVLLVLAVLVLVFIVVRQRGELSLERERRADDVSRARKDSVAKSRVATLAGASERVAPLLPDFPFDPADVQWIGGTVDCVVWDGLTSDDEIEVVFLDVKTGKAVLSQRQRRIRKAIEAGRVRFEVFRPQLVAELPSHELTPEFLSTPYFLVGGDLAEMTEPDDEASTR